MSTERKPHLLDEPERDTLAAVLDVVIPPSEDGRFPGASAYDVWGYLCDTAPDDAAPVRVELERIEVQARTTHGCAFTALEPAAQAELVEGLRRLETGFLERLARHTVCCYYQQDRVLEAIGLEARAPYPLGHTVAPGDLSLVDPVRARGPVYREVD